MDHEKLVKGLSEVPIVTIGENAFVLTDRGLANLSHASLITSDNDGYLLEMHGSSGMYKVVKPPKTAPEAVHAAHQGAPSVILD